MLEALCRLSSTTLDTMHAEDGPPITQRTSGLGVESQQVVLWQTESADWDVITDAGMWPVPVVLVEPERQFMLSLL